MKLTLSRKFFCVAALVCAAAWNADAVNIVADPGFEASADGLGAHPFSASWTVSDPSGFSGVGGDSLFAHSGNNYAFLGASPNFGSLSQSLATVAGTAYTLSFWLANDADPGLGATTAFEAFFNGVSVFALPGNSSVFGYTQFTISGLVATGSATTLEFKYRHDNDFFRLDDVSVEAASVPESFSTIWLALPALAGLGLVHFSRARAKQCLVRI